MRAGWLLALGSVTLISSSCTAFPSIPSGECGNAVIDASEDCDTFALGRGLVCRPKGAADECHLDCTPRGGKAGACPSGWGCDSSFVCRYPTGFDAPPAPVDVGAWTLAAADFDGDGRSDVMSSEPLDSIGETRLRFHYFDRQAQLAETRVFPKLLVSPTIRDLSGDGLPDVSFVNGALGVLLGRADRSWLPETFTSYRVEGSNVRVVPVYDAQIEHSSPFLPLIDYSGQAGVFPAGASLFVIDPATFQLRERVRVADSIAQLVADPVSGNLFEDPLQSPCSEPVIAVRGATHFAVVNTCVTDDSGAVLWKSEFDLHEVALEPPAAIDAPPLVVDIDADGHLDVLLGAGGRAYVAYGDGSELSSAVPYALKHAADDGVASELPMPLAVGDLTGDGAPDFVFSDHLLVSTTSGAGALPRYVVASRSHLGSPWTAAQFADFNGNGQLDLVVASSAALNVEFYNGTGSALTKVSVISTSAPVQSLTAADLDGDSITDVVIGEFPRPGQTKSSLSIAFGAAFAVPSPPVTVAQVTDAEAVISYQLGGIGNLAIASNEVVDGKDGGALTLLDGSGDRVPFASFVLTEFASSGKVADSPAFALAAGNFSSKGSKGDLLALAFIPPGFSPEPTPPVQPWLLPSVESAGTFPTRLADGLDPRLHPLEFAPLFVDHTANVASTSADLNGDGRDEAIFAMPAGDGRSQCGLLVLGADGPGSDVAAQEVVLLPPHCLDPQLVAVDADADRALDLALLTGEVGSGARQLYVLWNDGKGGFSSSNSTLVSSAADSPEAFAALPGTPPNPRAPDPAFALGRPFGFAYVTQGQVVFVGSPAHARAFDAPLVLQDDLHGGSGIVAADVNGDGVSDLVIAESGMLRVLKARLEVP